MNYRLEIRNVRLGRKLKIILSSFLFDGIWGITNVQLIAGCINFASFD